MALSSEEKAALLVVSAIWTSQLANYETRKRSAVLARWIRRHETIYDILLRKFEKQAI